MCMNIDDRYMYVWASLVHIKYMIMFDCQGLLLSILCLSLSYLPDDVSSDTLDMLVTIIFLCFLLIVIQCEGLMMHWCDKDDAVKPSTDDEGPTMKPLLATAADNDDNSDDGTKKANVLCNNSIGTANDNNVCPLEDLRGILCLSLAFLCLSSFLFLCFLLYCAFSVRGWGERVQKNGEINKHKESCSPPDHHHILPPHLFIDVTLSIYWFATPDLIYTITAFQFMHLGVAHLLQSLVY